MTFKSRPAQVFILDDNPGDRVLIRKMLQELAPAQFQVEEAWNLADALKQLKAASIDVLLLDLNLPDSRGIETIVRIRAASSTLPILVVSGIEDKQTAQQALDRGAQGHLIKGRFSAKQLGRAIQRCLSSELSSGLEPGA